MSLTRRQLLRLGLPALAMMALLFLSMQYDTVASVNRLVSEPSRSQQERVDLVVKLQVLKHLLAERYAIR